MRVTIRWAGKMAIAAAIFWGGPTPANAQQRAELGKWSTECATDRMTDRPGCKTKLEVHPSPSAGFVMLIQPGPSVGWVGRQDVLFAQMRIDKNPVHACSKGLIGCEFGKPESMVIASELSRGTSLIFTLATQATVFKLAESIEGYRGVLAKHREWGYAAR